MQIQVLQGNNKSKIQGEHKTKLWAARIMKSITNVCKEQYCKEQFSYKLMLLPCNKTKNIRLKWFYYSYQMNPGLNVTFLSITGEMPKTFRLSCYGLINYCFLRKQSVQLLFTLSLIIALV